MMKYCTKCGKEIMEEAVICPSCGCKVESAKAENKPVSGLGIAAKVLMIISCVATGWLLIPLAWNIPMTVSLSNKLSRHEPIGTGFKVCVLLFSNLLAGILLLCMEDE